MPGGQPKKIKTPEILWNHFQKYLIHCKESPKKENFWSHKQDKQVSIEREIPATWEGFEVWLYSNKIIVRLDDYKSNRQEGYNEYADIIRAIEGVIWKDQYDGATAGIFQHNIIARKLGLIDKREETGGNFDFSKLKIEIVKGNKEDE